MWNEILKVALDALSVFLQTVLQYALPVLASLAAAWLVAAVKVKWQEWKEKHTASAEVLASIAKIAVQAAEQMKLNQVIDDKKAYALEVVENYLTKLGLKLDVDSIEAAVEAAVMEQFNKEK